MKEFWLILRIVIGFLILICLLEFEYCIYALFGWIGASVYTAIFCLAIIGGSIITMEWIYCKSIGCILGST